jgi:hypothetical protein
VDRGSVRNCNFKYFHYRFVEINDGEVITAPRMIGITYTRKANGINHYEIQRPIEDARIFMRRI